MRPFDAIPLPPAAVVSGLRDIALIFAVAAYVRLLEKCWPIDPALSLSHKAVVSDWKVVGVTLVLVGAVRPVAAVCTAMVVSAAGGGLIALPAHGLAGLASFIGVVLAVDLVKYWDHRLKHMVPWLWAMHSFHHSAEGLTWPTGARHYWAEQLVGAALLPVIPILFRLSPPMVGAMGVIYFLPDTCAHANVRLRLGRFVSWIGNPQWHRIHHSVLPEHYDRNFSALLPLWDFVFGTAYVPRPDEYPPTGLGAPEEIGVLEGVVWPFRKTVRALAARST